jgi:dienelactone hydrolase
MWAAVLALWASATVAQVVETKLTYRSPPQGEPSLQIPATLRLPPGTHGPLPVVVVVHSSGGVEDTNRAYITELNAAGIATFEVDYFTPRHVATLNHPGNGVKPNFGRALIDSLSALTFLSHAPGIEPTKIGILGFSFGGAQALMTASLKAGWLATAPFHYAAHVALYPGCSSFAPGGPIAPFMAGPLDGAPALVLGGTADSYDAPDSCQQFVDSVPPESRPLYSAIMYPGATHGWDKPNGPRTMRDPTAQFGKGIVTIRPDSATTRQSIEATVAFFRKAFAL